MSFREVLNGEKQETEVVFDAGLIARVPRLLEVIAGSSVLNQRAVYIVDLLRK